jgi:asparagine synthase (glutamine-hydrolysing)
MCGIAGIVSFAPGGGLAVADDVLRRMSGRLAHRGPDGEGIAVVRGNGSTAGLVHRRLAILDPDPRSDQPFAAEYQGRRAHLVYNGEIYNYRELRRDLQARLPGFPWRTTGDTEVLLAAYFAWGAACADGLVGMFAFAVWDETQGTLLLVRDRMGQKPLFVSGGAPGAPDSDTMFASELEALTVVPGLSLEVDDAALSDYLALGYVPAPATIYRGIRKHPAGVTTLLAPGRPAEVRAIRGGASWEPASGPGGLRGMIEAAVESQLVSDVPLGCFLSGGIDSSVVACCAQAALVRSGSRLRTFTARFEDARYDESPFAAEVARHLGTQHTEFLVRPDAAADLPGLARSYGEPFADSSCLPTYYLSRQTREHVKVALAGDGGDELFGGYDRYRAMVLAERLGSVAGLARWALDPDRLSGGHPKGMKARLGRFLAAADLPAGKRYESFVRLFPPGMLGARELTGRVGGHPFPAGDVFTGAMQLDRLTYLPDDLLTKVDRASMRVALEVRAPFMDHRLVELAGRLGREEMMRGGKKGVLKRAFGGDLPRAVFARRKMGFAVPIGEWFRGELREMLRSLVLSADGFGVGRFGKPALEAIVVDHESRQVDHSQRLFALLMLELWHRGRSY